MISEEGLRSYKAYAEAPWGKLYYRILFAQLDAAVPELCAGNMRILDYGSGFGITADHYAASNQVIGLEPDEAMIRESKKGFMLVRGALDKLKQFEDQTFDIAFCHNVLEYADHREEVVSAIFSKLKSNGILSIVKHNKAGKVNSLAVCNSKPDEALALYHGEGKIESDKFGEISYYNIDSILGGITPGSFIVERNFGIRVFFGNVADNEIKYNKEWSDAMFKLEMEVAETSPYRDIAFWEHYIVSKLG